MGGRTTAIQVKASTKRLATGFLDSATTMWDICTKHTSRVARKLKPEQIKSARAEKLLAMLNNKAARLRSKKKGQTTQKEKKEPVDDDVLWKRSILKGNKCRPLNFSGEISYDINGKLVEELYVESSQGSPTHDYFCNSSKKK